MTGLVALVVIILSIPFYYYKEEIRSSKTTVSVQAAGLAQASFVGKESCRECHKAEYNKWKGSHHDLAMDVADDTTVLGDFNDRTFQQGKIPFRFFKKEKKFYVNTLGPDGRMTDFQITHTFGAYPLQQYLIPFPGGRLQSLTIAWDVEKKQWYDLYPGREISADDWLHWTGQAQNWNSMCADCHATGLVKGYDDDTGTYATSWSEIDVSCEACHGPGSRHVEWARLPGMARPTIENCGLVNQTSGQAAEKLIALCARCHARRTSCCDYTHPQADVLDHMIPQLLSEGIYFPDGQILEEDYVYGSFLQSKMYHRDVRCSDCHDVHSLGRVKKGNELCLQCHRRQVYDTSAHHFHKKEGEQGEPVKWSDGTTIAVGQGALCQTCHMPGRYYMGVDFRRDHSLRIPRPDLSVENGTPNACTACHQDKPGSWAAQHTAKWYGEKKTPHYGTLFSKARQQALKGPKSLIETAGDTLLPMIVRATALSLLAGFPEAQSIAALQRGLEDDASLIRHTAMHTLNSMALPQDLRIKLAVPLLFDPVKGVRMEAALCLSPVPKAYLKAHEQALFESALEEYVAAMTYQADFPGSQFNLARVYANLSDFSRAEMHYKKAIGIDSRFYPAKVNLAMLYNRQGKKNLAETLLKEACDIRPDLPELAYSTGLLLAERNKLAPACLYLERAANGLPNRARVHYNFGLVQERLGRFEQAKALLAHALELEPENVDFLYALAVHYIKVKQPQKAAVVARKLATLYPEFTARTGILDQIRQALSPL